MFKLIIYKIKKNQYILFLFKLFLLFFIIFCADFVFGMFASHLFYKQTSGPLFINTYSIDKTTEDILIFGSSRANHHFHPKVFEERLHGTCFNVGRDGYSILYHQAILKSVLKRYTPKTIILDIKADEFKSNQTNYERLAGLLPYYRNHDEIHEIVELKDKFEKYKLLSFCYPYNSKVFYILLGNSGFNKKRRNEINGYVPMKKTLSETAKLKILKEPIGIDTAKCKKELDTNLVNAYESFIKDCIRSGVKLYIVSSPYFNENASQNYSIGIGREIAKKYNIEYYNYSNDAQFVNNTSLFADTEHLNDTGAVIFSNRFIDNIIKKPEAISGK